MFSYGSSGTTTASWFGLHRYIPLSTNDNIQDDDLSNSAVEEIAKESYLKRKKQREAIYGGGIIPSLQSNPILWSTAIVILLCLLSLSIWSSIASQTVGPSTKSINPFIATTTSTKPHVIFILADDMGWNSIGYENYDLDFVSPVLTNMASNGVILNSFYAQEVCTPSRGSLLTGRYPLTIGMQFSMVQTAIPWGLENEETTIAQVLKANGYKTHMLGKWHLGHYTPRKLPTARGFDTFTGFVNGESYYWSKRNPDHTHFKDMLNMTTSCYTPYTDDDIHTYSTYFYRDKAIDLINNHDPTDPFFLYLAFQAVHDPFNDITVHEKGIPKEYIDAEIYNRIHSDEVVGRKRRQYAMALNILDTSVDDIVNSLDDNGMLHNSIIIFASDNGGCYGAGGKNGPLRGTKGSLFEGGTKVDSFFWSPMLTSSMQGQIYKELFHISDWFPTILDMADVVYVAAEGYELDGLSHFDSIVNDNIGPRDYMLYNYYYEVDKYNFKVESNGSFAVRNLQYKLVHTFNSSIYAQYYQPEDKIDNDDAITIETRCAASANTDGDYVFWLFDLFNDPYETTNLYNSTDINIINVKQELYDKRDEYAANAFHVTFDFWPNLYALKTWQANDDYMVPYVKEEDLEYFKGTYPENCYTPTKSVDSSRRTMVDLSMTNEDEKIMKYNNISIIKNSINSDVISQYESLHQSLTPSLSGSLSTGSALSKYNDDVRQSCQTTIQSSFPSAKTTSIEKHLSALKQHKHTVKSDTVAVTSVAPIKLSMLEAWDVKRTFDLSLIRAIVVTPFIIVWYPCLQRMSPGAMWYNLVGRITIDQLIGSPIVITLVFLCKSLLHGTGIFNGLRNLHDQGLITWLKGLQYWPIVHSFTFGIIPPTHRPLFSHIMSIYWMYLLSYYSSEASTISSNDTARQRFT